MYISADIRAGYKDVCVRGCKHKGGEGPRAGAPRENTGRGGEGAGFIYVHPVFRDTKHIGRLSL